MQTLLLLALAVGQPAAYPRANMLIEAADLAKLKQGGAAILDSRAEAEYAKGHIPGAVRVSVAELSKSFYTVKEPEKLGEMLGSLGIDPPKPVVIYGDDIRESARLWFLLRAWGLTNVKLLNGGWLAWKESGARISTDSVAPAAKPVQTAPEPKRWATKEHILETLKTNSAQLLDSRSEKEYCGEAGAAKKRGAIPGAVHLEWSQFVEGPSQKIKGPADLRKVLNDAGIDPAKPVITYCQSGGRAAVAAFAVELMGGRDVRNYYRSWAEWGNADDTPVEKPKKK